MRSAMWCFILLFALIIGSSGGNAFAESKAAKDGPSMAPASSTRNTAVGKVPVAQNSSAYASAIKTSAAVHPDSSAVKQSHSPQGSSPSSSGPKPSFWQRISGKKVDCSSGVCIVK